MKPLIKDECTGLTYELVEDYERTLPPAWARRRREATESMDDVQMIGVLSREGADPDPVLDEVLSSMGTLFKPLP